MAESLNVRAGIKGVGRAQEFIRNFCRTQGVPEEFGTAFRVRVDEFLSSIVPVCTSPRIALTLESIRGTGLRFTTRHGGPFYDISDEARPVWPAGVGEFSPLVLHRLHEFMDEIICLREGEETLVILTKYPA